MNYVIYLHFYLTFMQNYFYYDPIININWEWLLLASFSFKARKLHQWKTTELNGK